MPGTTAAPGMARQDRQVRSFDPTDLPPVRHEPAARSRIRAANERIGRLIAVLDDDPTGSQTVRDLDVVTVLDPEQFAAGLEAGAACFILTNTRSLDESGAGTLNRTVGAQLFSIAAERGASLEIISRSDSTLRGHVFCEVAALNDARIAATGRGYDGVLLVPAFFEAGRFTAGDIHWARVGDEYVPVGDTEFATDPTFGYASSNLRDFIVERGLGAVAPDSIVSIGLDDIRIGGPERVREILVTVRNCGWVVVNATDYADLEIVALGLIEAREQGRSYLYRTGPSFVRAITGLEPHPPLASAALGVTKRGSQHGLVVVGSHVGQTTEQISAARTLAALAVVELDVATLATADHDERARHIRDSARRAVAALRGQEVLIMTSRKLFRGKDPQDSLRVARAVSQGVTEVVRLVNVAQPAWVITKGGITSHNVAADGLGIRRARVAGQLFPGLISVLHPVDAAPQTIGTPWVVFAGNVGGRDTLAQVIQFMNRAVDH